MNVSDILDRIMLGIDCEKTLTEKIIEKLEKKKSGIEYEMMDQGRKISTYKIFMKR